MTAVSIPGQFNGPPGTGHGGYSCGVFARQAEASHFGGPSGFGGPDVEVTLRLPPPLETPMSVVDDGELIRFLAGEALVAQASAARIDLTELSVPAAPTVDQAVEAQERSAFRTGEVRHPFPTCFGCGPARTPADGLRQWPGLLDDRRAAACVWVPAEWTGATGEVAPEMVWAGLDCPGALGAMEQIGTTLGEETWVLGRMTASQVQVVRVGEPVVVLGWLEARSGRKRMVGSGLVDQAGTLLAVARATWVVVG